MIGYLKSCDISAVGISIGLIWSCDIEHELSLVNVFNHVINLLSKLKFVFQVNIGYSSSGIIHI